MPIVRQTLGTGFTEQPYGLWAARLVSFIFGTATILLAMVWVRQFTSNKLVILLTGLLIVFCPLLVQHSAYFTPDMIATFFVTAALFSSTMIAKSKSLNWYIAAGLFVGLAASSKYNAGLSAAAIIAAHLSVSGISIRNFHMLVIAGLVSVASFVLTSPFFVLDYQNAFAGLVFELNHYASGHLGAEGDSLRTNAAWIVSNTGYIAIFAFGLAFAPKPKLLFPALIFVLLYFLLISTQTVRFERNVLPIVPAIFVFSIVGISSFVRKWTPETKYTKTFHGIVFTTVITTAFAAPFMKTMSDLTSYARDPRQQSRAWLENTIPENSDVILDAYSPFLTSRDRQIRTENFILNQTLEWFQNSDYIVITLAGSRRYLNGGENSQSDTFGQVMTKACQMYEFPEKPRKTLITVFKMNCEDPSLE